jgi:hypothetical protein
MPEPGFVQIIHPGLGPDSVSEVPESSLGQHYAAGWRLLADDDLPEDKPEPEPAPVSRAQATKASKKSEEK